MKKFAAVLVLIAAGFVLGACAHGGGMQKKTSERTDVIYWCNCGADCKCNAVATKPGKCGCGKEMAGGHVVYMEGNNALACPCGPDCECKIDPNDHNKCGCGKPVKRLNLLATGLYFCNCAGSCACNTISDKPGTCSCGMPLHLAK